MLRNYRLWWMHHQTLDESDNNPCIIYRDDPTSDLSISMTRSTTNSNQGHAELQYKMACICDFGREVISIDKAKARILYKLAARLEQRRDRR